MTNDSEQALHDEGEWLHVTLASIGDAVITTDTDGNVTFLNPVAESLTGWSVAEACGKLLVDVFNIVNEETRNQVESPTVRALREGVVVGLANHTLLIAKDGKERPIDDSAAPIRNAKEEVAGVVLVFRDITERKRAEREMAHLAAIVASSDDAIISKDLSGIITSWNQGAQRLFGYAAEEVIGKPISLLIPAEDQDKEPEILERIRRGEAIEHYVTVRQRKDGTFLDISLTVSPIRDAGGRIIGASKIARDITERKRMQADLERSEIRYRRLFEAAKDGILILDTVHGRVTDANPFMTNLLGYAKEEFIGKEIWEIGLLKDASESRAMVRELQEKKYIRYEHLPLETTAGQQVAVEFVANVYQEDYQPVIQCNIRDITERSLLEEKTKEQAKSLADLHRRKDEFLAMLSHELRNPLAPIQNAVHLLRLQRDGSPPQVEAHAIIDRQVAQLARLVDDLLEVSRITTGRIYLHEDRVDFRGIVTRAMEATQPQTHQKCQAVAKSLPDAPIWVYGDPVRLQQVVVNLINNASKYTDRDGQISVVLKQDGDDAVLSVRDTGVGIAPEMLPRIFDLFTQADTSLDRSQGGLGIGLTLVQSLVAMHHGQVEAKSSPGQGSEFIVTLPMMLSPDVPVIQPTETVERPVHSLKVLVVDDNVDAATSVAMLLRAFGHDARLAHHGAGAMQAALEYVPDVVLLDIGLPIVSGYEVAKWIRQEPVLKNVVLVALTGYGQESDKQRTQEAGFDQHLVKPADFGKIQSILLAIAEKVQ